MLGDQYGGLLPSGPYRGFSATHAEFEEARAAGKRITFWARRPDDSREGPANKFLTAVGIFHVYGSFADASDLVPRVMRRLREIATEDEAPWVKLGDIVFRATRITGTANKVTFKECLNTYQTVPGVTGSPPTSSGGRDPMCEPTWQ